MTTEELSNEFDVLVQSYAQLAPYDNFGNITFTEYEKSIFLTRAQESMITENYIGHPQRGEAFESTEFISSRLRNFIKEKALQETIANTKIFKLPSDLLYIIREEYIADSEDICFRNKKINVVPVTHDNYDKIKGNPFKNSNNRRGLRLDIGNNEIKLITDHRVKNYFITYIRKPKPIILTSLDDESSIDGYTTIQESELPEGHQRELLEKAVRLALTVRSMTSYPQQEPQEESQPQE